MFKVVFFLISSSFVFAETLTESPNQIIPKEQYCLDSIHERSRRVIAVEDGITPLMLAVAKEDESLVKKLLAEGTNKWATTKRYKANALSLALRQENYSIARILLDAPDELAVVKICLSEQKLRIFKNGEEIFSTNISSGKSGHATPKGHFIVTEKYGTKKRSTIYGSNMPYFMRLNYTAIGIHGGHLPGYPASHGCIRIPNSKAQKVSKLVPVGSDVYVN